MTISFRTSPFYEQAPIVRVKCAANGSTDDTSAIQSVLTSLYNAGGGYALLPAGTIMTTGIEVPMRCGLLGAGMRGTSLKLANSTNQHVVRVHTSTDLGVTDPNAAWTQLRDLQIDGNAGNQSAANHGIYLVNTPDPAPTSKPAADDYFDFHHLIHTVRVTNVLGTGVYTNGRSETRFINVVVYLVGQHGFYGQFDTWFHACTASGTNLHGFYMEDESSFNMVGCKAFYCGQSTANLAGGTAASTTADRAGYHFDNCHSSALSGCIAQDNWGAGFLINNTTNGITLTGCVAESNSRNSAGSAPGYDVYNSNYNQIKGCIASDRKPGGTTYQRSALQIRSNSSYNDIDIKFFGLSSGVLDNSGLATPIANAVSGENNRIRINGQDSVQEETVTYAATVTPNPFTGATKKIALTGNITINAPTGTYFSPGTRMGFIFTQDSTGGRTITWNSAYKTNWAPDLSANGILTINFEFDGTNWNQLSTNQPRPAYGFGFKFVAKTGRYYPGGQAVNTSGITMANNGRCYAIPWWVSDTISIDRLSFWVTVAENTRTLRPMIWSDDGTFQPGTVLVNPSDVTLDTNTGIKEATVSATLLGGQVIWIGLAQTSAGAGTAQVAQVPSQYSWLHGWVGTDNSFDSSRTGIQGTLSGTTFTSHSLTSGVPAVRFRVA